jgi:hypothetical protein
MGAIGSKSNARMTIKNSRAHLDAIKVETKKLHQARGRLEQARACAGDLEECEKREERLLKEEPSGRSDRVSAAMREYHHDPEAYNERLKSRLSDLASASAAHAELPQTKMPDVPRGGQNNKKTPKKRYVKSPKGKRLVRKGPRGGKYYIYKGKKVYLSKKK